LFNYGKVIRPPISLERLSVACPELDSGMTKRQMSLIRVNGMSIPFILLSFWQIYPFMLPIMENKWLGITAGILIRKEGW